MEMKDYSKLDVYQLKNFPFLKTPDEYAKEKTFSFSKDKLKSGFLSFSTEIHTCLT